MKPTPGLPLPTEEDEQRAVVEWMTWHHLCFAAIPNGGYRRPIEAAIFKGQGVQSGVPDLLIFDAPPTDIGYRGAAIEMKRQKGGRVSDEQHE